MPTKHTAAPAYRRVNWALMSTPSSKPWYSRTNTPKPSSSSCTATAQSRPKNSRGKSAAKRLNRANPKSPTATQATSSVAPAHSAQKSPCPCTLNAAYLTCRTSTSTAASVGFWLVLIPKKLFAVYRQWWLRWGELKPIT